MLDIYTIWVPIYRVHVLFKALTAMVSLYTGVSLIPLIPQLLALKDEAASLQSLNSQLEVASRIKSEFISNMSHEIRTPLHVLIGVTDLLEESELNEEKKHFLEIARKSGDSLLNIINNILDLSKIESGLVELENIEIDLPRLVKSSCDIFSIEAQRKGLKFTFDIAPEIQNIYTGDPTRIQQILFNIISNALKFTIHGEITLIAKGNAESTVPGNIRIEVIDSGIGIGPDELKTLFRPFSQADSTITRKYGGSGLGLSISSHLAGMMGGSIRADSIKGRGSRFILTLHLPILREKKESHQKKQIFETFDSDSNSKSKSKSKSKQLKILVVDDSEDNRNLIRIYLKSRPQRLIFAENGQSAVNIYKEFKPDLVLMDIQMPVLNGISATRQMREIEKEKNWSPAQIWALTAHAMKEDLQENIAAGCDLQITKPFHKNELLKLIDDLARA